MQPTGSQTLLSLSVGFSSSTKYTLRAVLTTDLVLHDDGFRFGPTKSLDGHSRHHNELYLSLANLEHLEWDRDIASFTRTQDPIKDMVNLRIESRVN